MGALDNAIKFVANHIVAIMVAFGIMAALVVFFAFTDTGKAGIKLMIEQPIYLLLLAALLALPLAVYLAMLRIKGVEEPRIDPLKTWDAAKKRYASYFQLGMFDYRRIRRDPTWGVTYTGQIFPDYRCSIKFSDKPSTLGMLMDSFGGQLADEQITTMHKKELSLEERIREMGKTESLLENIKQKEKLKETSETVFGTQQGVA